MIDDQLVLRVERLRDEVDLLKRDLRACYSTAKRPVSSRALRERATTLSERWLVEIASRPDIAEAVGPNTLADRNIQFQRLLTYSERNTLRKKYDQAIAAILKNFRTDIVVPLKAHRGTAFMATAKQPAATPRVASVAFVGQSFTSSDEPVNRYIERLIVAMGISVVTGEKPRADKISQKVRERIDSADIFVGIFTCRDKIEGRAEWNTSAWVIDEKAYALARSKKLVLLREEGVTSIGGLQGDYEYLEFDRNNMADLMIRMVEMFAAGSVDQ